MSKEQALKLKEEGNAFLKHNNFDQAVEAYTQAIALDNTSAVLYLNRAQAHIKLENYGLTIADATSAIERDPDYRDLKLVLARSPGDVASKKLDREVTKILRQQAFSDAILGEDEKGAIDLVDFDAMTVEATYDGPALEIRTEWIDVVNSSHKKTRKVSVEMTREYIDNMVQRFKGGKQLPKKHAYAIVAAANEVLKGEASLVEIALATDTRDKSASHRLARAHTLSVCGDTHGQFYDVLNIFEQFGAISETHAYLFNGDFVDRGSWSCEVALLLYAYKLLYPTQVYLNRGNHETDDMNEVYGFKDECKVKYSEKLYKVFSESFNSLPFAALIGGDYLIMHGGLFSRDNVTLDHIRKIDRFRYKQPPKEGIEMELLWTDPQVPNGRAPSKRGIGMQFGPDITERFCLTNKLKAVIRSHEVRMGGYEIEHNGRLITVFSAPNYCDSQGNLGSVIDMTMDEVDGEIELKYNTFTAVAHPDIAPMAYTNRMGF
ncbi:hypothetical protein BABINDRAFT_39180 [Babjeviella inositovora NRRL Y-12698]|uniref:Serine/threonine-protein phosphatase n=1 Tax=Babjeviella inositovora NRRL Y-12698 TaxID=984486 RepID=A0A1E3QLV4_9ASCO|nr:uncharacterized protein BABINDRAFT_39180 [Babjeviella inositovora NRRL Y-12698]ODQ78444.1 hypothetical protein BABINDRAFT_39180 [Babjeviella inositovora NRRL Y-12698]